MGDSKALARVKTTTKSAVRIPVRRQSNDLRLLRTTKAAGVILQPALEVGAANDPLEHEAEAMADRIVTMAAPAVDAAPPPADSSAGSPAGASGGGATQPQRFVLRAANIDQESQPDTDTFESEPSIPADHQDPQVPATEDVDTAGLDQGEFSEIETGRPNDPKDDVLMAPGEECAVGAEGGDAPKDVSQAVAQPGAGRPLQSSVRQFMEPRFGVDFSDVRIHDGPQDRSAADRIGARAFTHREHIWLGKGESVDNRRLLAHELTHVVQQTQRKQYGQTQRMEVEGEDKTPRLRRGWIASKAEKIARNVPGYTLLTVIIGKSPITGNRVTRNAENLIGGFLGLLPGGNLLFEKLKETRALQRAFDWVAGRLSELNITWSRVKQLVNEFIDEKPVFSPLKTAKRIFKPLVNDVIQFIVDIKDKILEFILRGALALAGSYGEKVWAVIQKAGDTISMILSDPLGFAKNLVSAIVKGFKQFGSNIWKHLKKGLMGWLFGTLQGLDIDLPAKLDFKGIMSVVLQILGLTYANFRKILVKRLGTGGEKKVAYLEKSVEVVKTLLKEGFLGIWQRVLEMIEGFKTTVIDGIRDFVINTVVMGAVSWVAGLSNPVGAVIKIALSIYNMIKTFLERLNQIMEVANSIFSSIGAIAKGQIKQAADFIEKTIASTIPVFLAFVAALIPVTGITKTIRKIIKKLQTPVKKAMDKMVTFLVKKAKKLFSKLLGKVNGKRKMPSKGFKIGATSHSLIPKKKGNGFELTIASENPSPSNEVQKQLEAEAERAREYGDDAKCFDLFEEAFKVDIDEAEKEAAKIKPGQQKTSTKKPSQKANKELDDAAKKLAKLGPCITDNPFFDDKPQDGAIIRAREPRIPEIEGKGGLYKDLGKETKKKIEEVSKSAYLGARGEKKLSSYYENDHIPEKSFAKTVQAYVQGDLKKSIGDGIRDGSEPLPDPALGEIDTRSLGDKGNNLPAITVYRPLHMQKSKKTADRKHGDAINSVRQVKLPRDQIAALQAEIGLQIENEQQITSNSYAADKNASAMIKKNVKSGLKELNSLNKALYGFEPKKLLTIKAIKANKAKDTPGSDLDFNGDPNFADLEGQYANGRPSNQKVGEYIEYDHVVEQSLANKARDLTFDQPGIKGGMNKVLQQKIAALSLPADEVGPRSGAADKKIAKVYRRAVFAGKPIRKYNAEKAGTVALYRPVHRQVTANNKIPPLIPADKWAPVQEKLATYAVDNKNDSTQVDAAKTDLQAGVRDTFIGSMTSHTTLIGNEYKTEMKEFSTLNKSKQAATQMAGVVSRVAGTVKRLQAESLALLG